MPKMPVSALRGMLCDTFHDGEELAVYLVNFGKLLMLQKQCYCQNHHLLLKHG